jgi:MFS family permease
MPTETTRFDRDVWWIAFSAFFADLGYQAVIAGLPLFLVLTLRSPAWTFGLITALSYGPGSLVAYWGGELGDRLGRKRIAVLGNSLIPLLSFTGVLASPFAAAAFFVTGWWARNFRTPSRRAMLTEVVTRAQEARAFGLLHALDVGGGLLAALSVSALVLLHVSFQIIFLLTVLPLMVSTACLAMVRAGAHGAAKVPAQQVSSRASQNDLRLYRGVIIAAALYGFSSYSIGFPILTVAQGTHQDASGVLAYAVFLGISAVVGLIIGWRQNMGAPVLALLGYLVAGLGSMGLAFAYQLHAGAAGFYAAVALLGAALGVIETLEPTIISRVTPEANRGHGMGMLTAARSLGLFTGNLSMGILYEFSPLYSYGYAALVAVAAMLILLSASWRKGGEQEQRVTVE